MAAIIHLQKQSRHVNGRIGEFFRPDEGKAPHPMAEGLHIWQNRVLTNEEFNVELPKAIRRMQDAGQVFALILPDAAAVAEASQVEALKAAHAAEIEALKQKHAAEIAVIQDGVNEFTAKHNAELDKLRAEISLAPPQAEPLVEAVAEAPSSSGASAAEPSVPVPAASPEPNVGEVEAESKPKGKAKSAAK